MLVTQISSWLVFKALLYLLLIGIAVFFYRLIQVRLSVRRLSKKHGIVRIPPRHESSPQPAAQCNCLSSHRTSSRIHSFWDIFQLPAR